MNYWLNFFNFLNFLNFFNFRNMSTDKKEIGEEIWLFA